MNLSTDPWVWVGVLLTFCVFSFLYRENKFYRFAEHLVVGVANGYGLSFTIHRVLGPYLWKPLTGAVRETAQGNFSWNLFNPNSEANFVILIPMLIGALYFMRFVPRHAWLVRIPIAVFMGYYTGRSVPAYFDGTVFPQLKATIVSRGSFADSAWQGIWALLVLVGVLCTVSYFFFSREHKGVLRPSAKVGIIYVMIGFGASFGFTVMARISLAIGRFYFLMRDWLGIIS